MSIETVTQSLASFSHYVMENTDPKQKAALGVGAFALTYFLWSKARGWNERCILSKIIENKDVRLICKSYWGGRSELFWDVRNRITRITKRTFAVQDFFNCPETYLRIIEDDKTASFEREYYEMFLYDDISSDAKLSKWLKRIPITSRIEYVKDHEIYLATSGQPILGRITARSRFDSSVKIDRDNWAVTILCNGPNLAIGYVTGHAVIGIEGIKNGVKHKIYAHIGGDGSSSSGINIGIITDPEGIKKAEAAIVKNSQTWRRASHLVLKMLNEIRYEEGLQNKPFIFNILGGRTIISWVCERFSSKKHHNCYTWIVEKLEIANIHAQSNNILNSFVAIPAREIDGCIII